MKKLAISLALVATSLIAVSPAAEAHQLQDINNMYAIMHIEPNDAPVASPTPTSLLFYFGTYSPKYHFTLSDCDCTVTLKEGSKTISRAGFTTFDGSPTTGTTPITFAKAGAVTVDLSAHSKSGAFPDFALQYPVQVADTSSDRLPEIIGGLVILVAVVVVSVITIRKRRVA